METEHEFIAKKVMGVESRLTEWIAATEPTTTQSAVESRAAEAGVSGASAGSLAG
jgi:hypothetical protein